MKSKTVPNHNTTTQDHTRERFGFPNYKEAIPSIYRKEKHESTLRLKYRPFCVEFK
jgi:glutamate synthase (ferredoxin)